MNEELETNKDIETEQTVAEPIDLPHSATITEIATAAGVSVSTVSRAFSRPGRVSSITIRKIREVSDRLGYRTSIVETQDFSQRLTRQIAIVVSDLSNPVFADYIKGAQKECLKHGYGLLVIDTEENSVIEQNTVSLMRDHCDGIILGSSRRSDGAIRKLAEVKPVITMNRPVRGLQSVISNVHVGLSDAVQQLEKLGHREFTYIAGPERSWQEGVRWRSISALCALRKAKLRRIPSAAPTFNAGQALSTIFLEVPTTAVIAYNDLLAMGFIAGLAARGIGVPEQVSVVGIDDTPFCPLVTPSLSSITMQRKIVAATAAHRLITGLRQIKKPSDLRPIVLDSTFIPRNSIAQKNSKISAE